MSDVSSEPNPALVALAPLIGRWRATVSRASFLDDLEATIAGRASLEWFENGFIVMRSAFDDGPPLSTSMIGRNEALDAFTMLYYDSRGVSRIFDMGFEAGVWTLSREDPGFHQRFTGRLSEDGATITAFWEKSHDDGVIWQHDFDLVYEREDRED